MNLAIAPTIIGQVRQFKNWIRSTNERVQSFEKRLIRLSAYFACQCAKREIGQLGEIVMQM